MHRQVELAPQGFHEDTGGRSLQEAGHVLDAEHVGARLHQLLGQSEVVVQGVELLARIRQVPRVAHGSFGDCPRFQSGLDSGTHPIYVVVRVEDAEDVYTRRPRLCDEGVHHLGRVASVADGVLAAQKHLQAYIG